MSSRTTLSEQLHLNSLPQDLTEAGWVLAQSHKPKYASGQVYDVSYRNPRGAEHWNYIKVQGSTLENAKLAAIESMRSSQEQTDKFDALVSQIQPQLDRDFRDHSLRIIYASFNESDRVYVVELENPAIPGGNEHRRCRNINKDLATAVTAAGIWVTNPE